MGAARPFDWKEAVALKHGANKERIPPKWRLAPDYQFPSSVIGVPAACGLLTPEELIMTDSEGETLLENLKEGTWTAVEVMSAFCKRASVAHQAANCLTEVFFERGLALAAEADRRREQGEPLGLLHGLPVSVKDQFPLGGAECNMGWASWIGRKHERSAVIVEALEAAGAIVFCRTNLSQGCWFPEGENLVYGITNNPFGAAFVPGGSSAGEGALNALRGSPLGVGTDIGGSVRIPASFCGIYGLKPTTRRFPYGRALNSLVGQENVESSLGPMSTSLSLCTAFTKAVLSTSPWNLDPSVVPIPWRQEMFDLKRLGGHGAQLSVGVYDFDGAIHILPPQKRAMKMMVAALRKAGHEIVPWKPTAYPEAVELLIQVFEADGGADLQDVVGLTGEPILPQVVVGKREGVTVFDTYLTNRKKTEVRELLLEQWLDTAKRTSTGRPIDCIIGPVAPYTASKHRQSEYFGYTGVYNLLDWPAIAVPVTHCDPELDAMTPEYDYEPMNEMDARIKASYDPVGAKGLPVGLQIVGRRFQEEELLGMTKVIMEALAASGV